MLIPDEYLQQVREKHSLPADSAPVRLFRSEFMERFTHTPVHWVPLVWVPLALLFALKGLMIWPASSSWWLFPGMLLLGSLVVWTLVEYGVHRLVFHSRIRWRWQEEFLFLLHGVHHLQPHTKTRLVLPLTVSVPIGGLIMAGFQAVFTWLGQPHLAYPFMAGFSLGYVTYDVLHYTLHHVPVKHPWLKRLKRHHLEHHFKAPETRFGVTNEFWDHAFGTHP